MAVCVGVGWYLCGFMFLFLCFYDRSRCSQINAIQSKICNITTISVPVPTFFDVCLERSIHTQVL
jgi:hypothetical protein